MMEQEQKEVSKLDLLLEKLLEAIVEQEIIRIKKNAIKKLHSQKFQKNDDSVYCEVLSNFLNQHLKPK